jgi:Mannosylglycerate hydrolase MGH1-like glycoside hydrolase domain
MREWNLKAGDPLTLSIAADARLVSTDYNDDQIWELSLKGGEPPALALQTTFGLRARSLRLFPRFTLNDQTRTDPDQFERPPVVHRFYPNYIELSFSPFTDIDVRVEYWVPESHAVCGRLHLANHANQAQELRLEWVGLLTPTEGQRMAVEEIQAAPVLLGASGDLAPLVFLTGGAQYGSSVYPSLSLSLSLPAGGSYLAVWSQAARETPEESFALARQTAARHWEAEIARVERINAGEIEVHTGDPNWDAALALSQKLAYGLLVGPSTQLPNCSFVLSRQPDQGYSLRGDGSDYNHLWNGQPSLEALYLASLILPNGAQITAGLLKNYLATQEENGFIDWRPGLGGQRSRLLATPVLCSLAWKTYEACEDLGFLRDVFPHLLQFLAAWFDPQHDRDGDGAPEWDHPMQAGTEDTPLFSRWQPWSQGVDISTAESPGLNALLYMECQILLEIARLIGEKKEMQKLRSWSKKLKTAIQESWDENAACYRYRDRDTHKTPPTELLGERKGTGFVLIDRHFDAPGRLLIHVNTSAETTLRPILFIHGSNVSGKNFVERIEPTQFKWYLGHARMTGERLFRAVEKVDVQGLSPDDVVRIYRAGYEGQDLSLLLPLWAGIPKARSARLMVEQTLRNPATFWQPFGLPFCAEILEGEDSGIGYAVNFAWNSLVIEGLMRYGFTEYAADLIGRLMNITIRNLKQDGAFRRSYHARSGLGIGDRNALTGLAPLGSFLNVLGVRVLSLQRLELSGYNPFPWPVTVKYRGLTILRQKDKTTIIFPDGQTITTQDGPTRIIGLE